MFIEAVISANFISVSVIVSNIKKSVKYLSVVSFVHFLMRA